MSHGKQQPPKEQRDRWSKRSGEQKVEWEQRDIQNSTPYEEQTGSNHKSKTSSTQKTEITVLPEKK